MDAHVFVFSASGWPKTHQVAEADFELLILLPAPPVLGFPCVQPCLVFWGTGDQTWGLVHLRHTLNNRDAAVACVHTSERDS